MSPKARAPLVLRHGDELKLVFPQPDLDPSAVESLDFRPLLTYSQWTARRYLRILKPRSRIAWLTRGGG